MKKWSLFIMFLLFFTLPFFNVSASGAVHRNATEVKNVSDPYTADEWIVSPTEEPTNDQTVNNAPECDIYGVSACYDYDYLRVDIFLNNEIFFDLDTLYCVKVEYDSLNEYYTYYTATSELVYEKEENGKITERKTLTKKNSRDFAGVSNSADLKNSDVYFIINKEDHVGGAKGNRYYLTCTFFSGYISKIGRLNIADKTMVAEVEFEK